MNNQVRHWDKVRDTRLITLRFPARPEDILKFLKDVEEFGEPWDEHVQYDPEEGWMFVEFEMGTGLSSVIKEEIK